MKTLEQMIAKLPPERREEVAKKTKQLIAEEHARRRHRALRMVPWSGGPSLRPTGWPWSFKC